MIIVTQRHIATVSGKVWKQVHCSACGCDYVYRFEAEARSERQTTYGIGAERARTAAAASAKSKLEKALTYGCALAACPDCGRYQPEMIAADKRKRVGQMALAVGVAAALLLSLALMIFLYQQYMGSGRPFRFAVWPLSPSVPELLARLAVAAAIVWTIAGLVSIPFRIRRVQYNERAEERKSATPGPDGPFRLHEWVAAQPAK